MSLYSSRITGTGSAFPETVVTNDDLSRQIETNDEWIRERTGIMQRRISKPGLESENNSSLGHRAALQALEMAGKRIEDIDAILYATCSPDTIVPTTSCWLQKKLGATRAWALDINAACSGFVYGVHVADQFIKNGEHQTILVVGAEKLSPMVDWKDRASCILFGDGAGAAIVERTNAGDPRRVISSQMGSDGTLWELFYVLAGGSNIELTPEHLERRENKMRMKGKEIFKVAVKTLADYATAALEKGKLPANELNWMIPHQANMRIIEAVARRLDFPMEQVLVNIERFGNTSAATVPTVLDENVRSGKIKAGDTILMDVFGAGLTYGSILARW